MKIVYRFFSGTLPQGQPQAAHPWLDYIIELKWVNYRQLTEIEAAVLVSHIENDPSFHKTSIDRYKKLFEDQFG